MGRTFLFSPVGGTDPISGDNCRDGSLLHICRVYHPDKVYLYLSEEMLEHHKKDDRYRYCLEKLQEMEEFQMTCEVIEREELKAVHQYDYFYREFYLLLSMIQEEMNDNDELLLNISSGTPAMKSALLVMQQITEGRAKCVQVVTPDGKRNIHGEITEYDVKTLWELNEDNEKPLNNRCIEVECPSLVVLKKLEIIKEQISKYDYQAASSIANTLPVKSFGQLRSFLEFAKARQDLNSSKIKKISNGILKDIIPLKGEEQDLFEYALNLENKLERKEYADFIRAITPILADLFERILRDSCGVDLHNFTRLDQYNSLKWDAEKLEGTEVKSYLDSAYRNGFDANNKFVQSDHIAKLIERKTEDRGVANLVRDLRNVE